LSAAKEINVKPIARRAFLGAAAALTLPAPAVRAQANNGVALVIGNSKYTWEAQLPNVKRDAPDIARRFEQLGLKTELLQDVSHDAMRQAIDRFAAASRGANLAAFYFAGHGAQWEKNSYIVPVDADLGTPSVVKSLPSVRSIYEGAKAANSRLLVFDACRNNPADGWRQDWAMLQAVVDRGAADFAPNTLMLYSTAPGRVALDGPSGQNSPFAAALLRQLANPSVDLQTLPGNLRHDLLAATEGRQVLWDANTYRQSFALRGPAGAAPGQAGDRSRVVELPRAYAFGREHDMIVPPGVIAYRPPAGSADSNKVGAFTFNLSGNNPTIVVVLAVDDPRTVELLLITRNGSGGPAFWRFTRGTLSGDTLDWSSANRYSLKWKDANSGSFSQTIVDPRFAQKNGRITTGAFTRLDG
jgi:hypothetical protein